ncbi:hypothetical protein WR25_07100 [Diploscapter pachys]|uniref:C-type lectin domain-containing protein n=1 Tax=Diploscapter pachys TaxID=2018661 RepID=A0A2A2KVZ4_9BILA|nr:hypothetical protein WR25_07100 [Diploscapter pachys]
MTYLKFFLFIGAICDDGYTYWNYYCYKGNSSEVLPIEGEAQCQAEGGHEVSIHSQEENDFVLTLFGSSPPPLATIGFLNNGENSGWWDESPWGDYNSTGLNNTANIGYCMAIAYDSQTVEIGQWVSVACTEDYLPFVCKKLAYGTPTAATTTVSQGPCDDCMVDTDPNSSS